MNILVVNNDSLFIQNLTKFVAAHGHEVHGIHWNDPDLLEKHRTHDLTVLSGSTGLPVPSSHEKLKNEIEICRNPEKPLIGICMGFQLICDTYGGRMRYDTEKTRRLIGIDVVHDDPIFSGVKNFNAFVSHKYHVIEVHQPLVVLAKSGDTIEVIKHQTKPIYGFQFHPESSQEGNQGAEIFARTLRELAGDIKSL